MPTKAEIKAIVADGRYWDDLVKGTGYKLYGYTLRQRATFHTPDKQRLIEINSDYLDLIEKLCTKRTGKRRK